MRLLIVEDDSKVASVLHKGLTEAHFETSIARTVAEAKEHLARAPHALILLDIGLPGPMDGLDFLKQIRDAHNPIPVIVLTARDEMTDKVQGLDLGADDYIVKPFAFPELLARIHALIRRSHAGESPVLTVGDLKIDLILRTVKRADRVVTLTPREFDLLVYLARFAGQVVSRDMLARDVWKVSSRVTPMDNIIDVHISHLRDEIDRDFPSKMLNTVRGVGFVLRDH